jgi:hypothetical protein
MEREHPFKCGSTSLQLSELQNKVALARRMVDYSRWDSFGVESDEDRPTKPRITTVDSSKAIRIGPQGWTVVQPIPSVTSGVSSKPQALKPTTLNYAKWDTLAAELSESDDEPTPIRDRNGNIAMYPVMQAKAVESSAPSSIGNSQRTSAHTSNSSSLTSGGGTTSRYLWSQDKTTLIMRIFAPRGTVGRDVQIVLRSEQVTLMVKRELLLEGKFLYPVNAEEDYIDWEIQPYLEQSVIVLTLNKKEIGQGVIVWWKSVFVGDPEIDTTQISDRKLDANTSYRQVWEKAHDMFKKKVAEQEPQVIDDASDNED